MACTTLITGEVNWIQIGPNFKPTGKTLDVYAKKEEVRKVFAYVGVARIDNVTQKRDDMLAAVNALKKYCAKKGADAVIISQMVNDDNGQVSMSAHGIKYIDHLTEDDKAAIEEFKILGAVAI